MAGFTAPVVFPGMPLPLKTDLNELLRRCPPPTREAALAYRRSGDARQVAPVIRGIFERFVEPDLRPLLRNADDGLRLVEDLGIDSLTLMEIALLVEDVFGVSPTDEDLRQIRTIGDVVRLATART